MLDDFTVDSNVESVDDRVSDKHVIELLCKNPSKNEAMATKVNSLS
jgi:hypothetical protein